MNDNVKQLETCTGLTPSMARVSQQFWDDVWAAVRKAEDAGLSTGSIVSSLEIVKAAKIKRFLED